MIIRIKLLIFLFFLLNFHCLQGQFKKVDQQLVFKSRIENPIETKVTQHDDRLNFYAINKSFYPYRVNIEFTSLINLSPQNRLYTNKVLPGNNKLFSLTVQDEKMGYDYNYKISYSIGIASKKVIFNYPYLIPISTSKKVELFYSGSDSSYFLNAFQMDIGDTVFNMRKGYLAAVPDMSNRSDRISNNRSLEIIHKDGTIMVYNNLDQDYIFIEPGATIYPGQPIGLARYPLIVNLYMIEKDGKLKEIDINYYLNEFNITIFSKELINSRVTHPKSIITKEMSKRESKKYN